MHTHHTIHPAAAPTTRQESGLAREYVMEEHLRPSPSPRKWTTCNVVKEGKTVFRMYLDDNQTCFMLSAKRVGEAFYISQYEAFPEVRRLSLRRRDGRAGLGWAGLGWGDRVA